MSQKLRVMHFGEFGSVTDDQALKTKTNPIYLDDVGNRSLDNIDTRGQSQYITIDGSVRPTSTAYGKEKHPKKVVDLVPTSEVLLSSWKGNLKKLRDLQLIKTEDVFDVVVATAYTAGSTSLVVSSATGFPSTGAVEIGEVIVRYTAVTSNTLTLVTGGFGDSFDVGTRVLVHRSFGETKLVSTYTSSGVETTFSVETVGGLASTGTVYADNKSKAYSAINTSLNTITLSSAFSSGTQFISGTRVFATS